VARRSLNLLLAGGSNVSALYTRSAATIQSVAVDRTFNLLIKKRTFIRWATARNAAPSRLWRHFVVYVTCRNELVYALDTVCQELT